MATTYTVQDGDYLYSIAERYGITVEELESLNPGIDPQALYVGQEIYISADPSAMSVYTVQEGDYMYAIAEKLGTTVEVLVSLNSDIDPDNLYIGQVINVPATAGATTTNPHGDNPNTASTGGALVTWEQFSNAVVMCEYPAPTEDQYNNFSANFPEAGIETNRELAMFLANVLHESDGLRKKSEDGCTPDAGGRNSYEGDGTNGQYYYGRGYIQLSHIYNYKAAGEYLGYDLVSNPQAVCDDESLAWRTAFWYWFTSVHSNVDVQNGSFSATVQCINGAIEMSSDAAQWAVEAREHRWSLYNTILPLFGVTETPVW